jgi:CRISPR-associated exonuclease Cas4
MSWWVLLGMALLVAAFALRRRTGVPWARVVYSDTRAWQPPPQALLSRRYQLVGKPDYLLKRGTTTIPVEVKPTRRARTPFLSDQMQLAAYCLLVEETTGRRPPYGILRYADTTFQIPFDAARRTAILRVLAEMRAVEPGDEVARSHGERARCAGCGLREQCDQSLA